MSRARSEVAPPSGRQVAISSGDQHATIVEVGGGLRSYRRGDWDVLDGYAVDAMASGGRGQILMPWPNRVADGAYTFDGTRQQLALSEAGARNAIHGLVRWVAWTVVEEAVDRVVLAHRLHPQPGYPFSLDLEVEYALRPDGLHVRTRAVNVGSARCPFGAGAHPYLSVGGGPIDDAILRLPASTVLHADVRGIPVSSADVQGTPLDFRAPRQIGSSVLDHAITDLERGADGRAWVELSAPEGPVVRLWVDAAYRYLMVFTGDTLPGGGRRSLAVEPMTCAPNAFASGDGLLVLEPGEAIEGSWGIEPGAPS
jgi:aldose 1-epimerase